MCKHKKSIRRQVKEAYGFQCQLSFQYIHSRYLVVHHILPIEYGGLTIPENLIPLSLESHAQIHRVHKVHGEGIIVYNIRGQILLRIPPPIEIPQLIVITPPPLVLAA